MVCGVRPSRVMVPSSLRIPLAVWTNMSATVAAGASGIGFPFRFEAGRQAVIGYPPPEPADVTVTIGGQSPLPRCATPPKTCSPPVDDDDARTGLQRWPGARSRAACITVPVHVIAYQESISASEDVGVLASRLLRDLDRSRNGPGGRGRAGSVLAGGCRVVAVPRVILDE